MSATVPVSYGDCTLPSSWTPVATCSSLFSAFDTSSLITAAGTPTSATTWAFFQLYDHSATSTVKTITVNGGSDVTTLSYSNIPDWQTECLPGYDKVGECGWQLAAATESCPSGWSAISTATSAGIKSEICCPDYNMSWFLSSSAYPSSTRYDCVSETAYTSAPSSYAYIDSGATATVTGWGFYWQVGALVLVQGSPGSGSNTSPTTASPASAASAGTATVTSGIATSSATSGSISATTSSSGSNTGLKIGLGVGLGVGIPILVVAFLFFWRYRKQHVRAAQFGVGGDHPQGPLATDKVHGTGVASHELSGKSVAELSGHHISELPS